MPFVVTLQQDNFAQYFFYILQVVWPRCNFKESSPLSAVVYFHYIKMKSL